MRTPHVRSLTVLLAASLACATATAEVEAGAEDTLAAEVLARIARDPISDPAAASILVESRGGVVRITGEVPDVLARIRVAELALAVPGVRAVINDVLIHFPPREPHAILADFEMRLGEHPVAGRHALSVGYRRGLMVLDGRVGSEVERKLNCDLALSVPGVLTVVDRTVSSIAPRLDADIEDDVRAVLEWEPRLAAVDTDVAVERGEVRLSGVARGSVSRAELVGLLATIRGVKGVELGALELHVEPLPPRDDASLRQNVLEALRLDPRLRGVVLDVEVVGGAARLTGSVSSAHARLVALEDASNVAGVQRVIDAIEAPATAQPAAFTPRPRG